MSSAPVLLVIAGPAGSGKSTLCDRLIQEVPAFQRVVTTTTRSPRDGEVNGVHYHFPARGIPPPHRGGELLDGRWSMATTMTGSMAR
jgi:guanylate kinase